MSNIYWKPTSRPPLRFVILPIQMADIPVLFLVLRAVRLFPKCEIFARFTSAYKVRVCVCVCVCTHLHRYVHTCMRS
jgi:hypothetical protein